MSGIGTLRVNLNFLKFAQLLIDGDLESNPGPTQNNCKSPRGRPKKIGVFKGTAKTFDLSGNINFNVASYPKVHNVFFNTIQPLSLNNIKPWSESLQKMKFDVNNDINSKVSF